MIGQLAVVHDLQQQVEDVGVSLLNLIEQQHRVGVLIDGIRHHAALIEPHVSGRRADQAGHGVPFHVLRHIEPDEFHTHKIGELARDLRLANARRA